MFSGKNDRKQLGYLLNFSCFLYPSQNFLYEDVYRKNHFSREGMNDFQRYAIYKSE